MANCENTMADQSVMTDSRVPVDQEAAGVVGSNRWC